MSKPELLLPAGNLGKLKIALQYGGDAFYLGFSPFSMRAKSTGFTEEDLLKGVELIKEAGKDFYLTMNIYPRGGKMGSFRKHIAFVREKVKPTAIIVADPGLFDLLREEYPEVDLHISVQANATNAGAVRFWKNRGATRVILPRELMLREIEEIHEEVPDIELEVFVHGAICMAYSGRCLLSNYMTERDSNQGACAHSCRWKYNVYLEEEKRPGQFMPIEEDENGTYIMNSKDNCMLPYLKKLVDAGVCSFKVEGRNKSEYYLSTVARAYRQAVDDMFEEKPFNEDLLKDIYKTANRGFIPGFLFGYPEGGDVHYESSAPVQTHKFIGMLVERDSSAVEGDDLYEVSIRNKLVKGEEIEVMTPDEQFTMNIEEMWDLEGEELDAIHGGAGNKLLKLRKGLPVGTMLRIKV